MFKSMRSKSYMVFVSNNILLTEADLPHTRLMRIITNNMNHLVFDISPSRRSYDKILRRNLLL